MECLFCKIGAKSIQAKEIYRDDYSCAFLDVHPCSPGHTLVIPLHHIPNMSAVPQNEVGLLWLSVHNVLTLLREKLAPEGFTIGVNHGEAAGQEIEHLHIHLIPRMKNDGGGSLQSVVRVEGQATIEEIYTKIIQ